MNIPKEQLTGIIKKKSVIWDTTDPGYKNVRLRESAWKEVCKTVEPDFENLPQSIQNQVCYQIKKKWYSLRDSYAKSRKNARRPHPNANMSFLNKLYTNVDENLSETETNNSEDSNNEPWFFGKYSISSMKRDSAYHEKSNKQRKSVLNILMEKPITGKLITLVKEKRCLWDKHSKDHKDIVQREEAWMAIFKAIEPTYDDLDESDQMLLGDYIIKKWRNIRGTYLRNVKIKRPYIYGNLLKFLNPNNTERKDSNVKDGQSEKDSFSLSNSKDVCLDIDDEDFEIPKKKLKLYSGVGSSSELCEMKITTRQLINAIRKERLLWDKTCSDYSNKVKREEAWKEVYKAFVPNFPELPKETQREIGNEISKKWYRVKNNYYNYLKRSKGRWCEDENAPVSSEMLSFLFCENIDEKNLEKQFINTNDFIAADDNSMNTDDDDDEQQFKEEFPEENKDTYEIEFETSSLDNTFEPVGGEIIINKDEEEKRMAKSSSLIEREDEDKSFFNAILSSVQSLSEESKLTFRINVLNLIQTLKNRDKTQIVIKQEPT